MSGIRTNAAAEILGVSTNTLRSWERRFDFPRPQRTAGGHRQYDLGELDALRRALMETENISSAIAMVRQRGAGPSTAAGLLDAFERFDEAAADRLMEESLAVRSVERSVEELLLVALRAIGERDGREAEFQLACRWATGWLHATRRLVPAAVRPEGVFLFDSSPRLDLESIQVQALEVALRRAGFRVLLLTTSLPQDRLLRAMRAMDPAALVLCGAGATLEVFGRVLHSLRTLDSPALLLEFRDATPVAGRHAIPSLGSKPTRAVAELLELLQDPRRSTSLLSAPAVRGTGS